MGGEERPQRCQGCANKHDTLIGYVKISEQSVKIFQKKSAGLTGAKAKKKSTGMTVGVNQDVAYFTFAISCDVLPTNLVSWIVVEWIRAGGIGLYWKEIQAFNTYLPFGIF